MFRAVLAVAKSSACITQTSLTETCLRAAGFTQVLCSGQPRCRKWSGMPDPDPEVNPQPSQTVLDVVDRIENLTVKDLVWLNKLLKERLGVTDDFSAMPMGMPMGMQMGAAAPAAPAADAPPPVAEKSEFNVIVESYDSSAKIKIIKEVRSILPELGLKDAKDLVDKIPATIKTGLSKTDADELKAKLEAVGATVKLD